MQELMTARAFYDAGNWQQADHFYRQVIQADPRNFEALDRLGQIALRANGMAAAADWLQQAADLDCRDASLYSRLGAARAKLKQFDQAVACFQQAVKLNPRSAEAHYNWGNVLSTLGQPEEAIEKFRAAAVNMPDSPEIHFNLANAARDLGRLNDAVAGYRQAIRLRPDHLKSYNNLGNVLREQGKLAEAVETYRAVLRFRPDYALGHHNLGLVLFAQNCVDEAVAEFREALQLQPDLVAARSALGKALAQQGRLDEAMPMLQQAQSQGNDNAEALLRLADQFRRAGRYDEAAANIRSVIAARADCAAAHNDLGLVWFNKEDYSQAVECYRQAIRIRPDLAEAHNNLAITLMITGDDEGGLAAVDAALRIKPDMPIAHLNRSVTWLRKGRFREGWHEFHWRLMCDAYRMPPLPAPLWDGSPMPDRCLLLYSEQGLGDTLQFIRYAPKVKQRCASTILQCQPGLAPLLSRCPGVDRVIVRGDSLPEYHVHVPLMSLPDIMETTIDTIPAAVPYVFADEALVETWRQRLAEYPGFRIGISWQGNPKYAADRLRSIPLRHFAPLARAPGVRLFSLQKGIGWEQIAEAAADCPIVDFGPDFDSQHGTFMDSAAVIRNLDLVITSDTAVPHLAGALGAPVWVALSQSADWRWLEGREDCPWYPTMRLFRQARLGDWDGLFARIAEELAGVVSGERRPLLPPLKRPVTLEAPLSPGELFDRLSILKIKRERIIDPTGLRNVCREWELLSKKKGAVAGDSAELDGLYAELVGVNRRLWEIEDAIRGCEAAGDFGPRFTELARSVYRTNDQRSALKRRINTLLGSELAEEKLYPAYR
ncbi:MAG: tetratricopeptide repeat protein [Thermoguttaceae bacterium]